MQRSGTSPALTYSFTRVMLCLPPPPTRPGWIAMEEDLFLNAPEHICEASCAPSSIAWSLAPAFEFGFFSFDLEYFDFYLVAIRMVLSIVFTPSVTYSSLV